MFKMSWLWKDKKTEQLKNLLHSSYEGDKKSVCTRLSKLKDETNLFKKHVGAAFANSRVTSSMKGRKHVIDGLEDKTTEVQNKIALAKQWNYNQMGVLEEKEHCLEASLIETEKKNDEMKAKAKEKEEEIKRVKGKMIKGALPVLLEDSKHFRITPLDSKSMHHSSNLKQLFLFTLIN